MAEEVAQAENRNLDLGPSQSPHLLLRGRAAITEPLCSMQLSSLGALYRIR